MPRYLFLDWSGDAGFRFGRGSSEYLILVLVHSTDYSLVRRTLVSLQDDLGLSSLFEFHYKQTPPRLRELFFDALVDVPVSAKILVVHKPALPRSFARMREPELYGHFVADLILRTGQTVVEGAYLLVDAQRSDVVLVWGIRVAISRALEEAGVAYRLKKVKARPAKEEEGLQIADMIAGAMLDRLEGKREYVTKLEERLRVWHYPPK
ncbi:MAG: DUF3800 domain-containing protein [Deltaproteobacteria bacterium]|nr:DUF3800 domain-containing protein [Deltaproteobacteria bacterium]